MKKQGKKKLNCEEMILFCSQMALILHSGISAFEGISLMMEDQKNPEGRAVLENIYREMEQGESLWGAMEKTEVFPDYACEMVSLGEFSGRLDQVMADLARYYSQEEELYQTVRHGVTYPLFMLIMMLGVLLVLMVKVMPVFQNVFLSLGMQMNGPAGAVLRAGQFLDRYLWIFVLLAGLILSGGLWLCRTRAGRAAGARWLQKLGFARIFLQKTAQYRLAYGMSMSLRSGLDPQRSMERMENLVSDPRMCEKIKHCVEQMKNGVFFEEAVVQGELFDSMHNRMIRIGQRTGAVDQVMEEIADRCQKEASENIWRKISLIEPTVVMILAVLVGLILLSVMLPLMGIMARIG